MKNVVQFLVMTALFVFAFSPLCTAFVDVFWWIFSGHSLTSVDWNARAWALIPWTVIVGAFSAHTSVFVAEL